MDEKDGLLRIATNLATRVQDSSFWARALQLTSRVQVLGQVGAELTQIGSTGTWRRTSGSTAPASSATAATSSPSTRSSSWTRSSPST
jgi:hypothetical protein